MVRIRYAVLLLGLILLLNSSAVLAESRLQLGVGGLFRPDYPGSDDYEWLAFPAVRASWRPDVQAVTGQKRSIRAGLLAVRLNTPDGLLVDALQIPVGDFNINTQLGLGLDLGRDEDENEALEGLGDIDPYPTGLFVLNLEPAPRGESSRRPFLSVHLRTTVDLTDETDGYTVQLEIFANRYLTERLLIKHGPFIVWGDTEHAESYFGVSEQQAAQSGYESYKADEGFEAGGYNISGYYRFNDRVGMNLSATYAHLLGDVDDSPIVSEAGDEDQISLLAAIIYSF